VLTPTHPHSNVGAWTIGNLRTEEMSTVISDLMVAGAWIGNSETQGFSPHHHHYTSLHALQARGFVTVNDKNIWHLTEEGRRAVTISKRLHSDRPAFEVRGHIPIGDCTVFELFENLTAAGWKWLPWVAPRSRGKRCHPIPEALRRGADRHFFTTRHPCKAYLQCLLLADEF